jgi:NDP-sugar pyrophosphorylase family protein
MKAVILAAGKGKRMGDLTKDIPKPMVHVKGKPILEQIITGIRNHTGIREFFIIIGHQGQVIEKHFGDGTPWGVMITYGTQVEQTGTGKAPELAKNWIGDDSFMLSYGDVMVNPEDYGQIAEKLKNNDAVIAVKKIDGDYSSFGVATFNPNFHLENFVEKPPMGSISEGWLNAGIYLFKSSLFKYTAKLEKSPRGEYELPDALLGMVRDQKLIAGHELPGHWVDVKDQEVLASLNK